MLATVDCEMKCSRKAIARESPAESATLYQALNKQKLFIWNVFSRASLQLYLNFIAPFVDSIRYTFPGVIQRLVLSVSLTRLITVN